VGAIMDKKEYHEYLASMESGICHGVSGLAYMYNKLYNLSSNTTFKVASDKCLNFLLENENINSEDVSLLDGLSGIGLSYLSALSNKKASWDRVLLLS
jgi:lantibiotic modifying enzyme